MTVHYTLPNHDVQAAAVVNVRRSLQVLVPMIAYVAAPASGAHFNPIVTFAFMATGILVRALCCCMSARAHGRTNDLHKWNANLSAAQ